MESSLNDFSYILWKSLHANLNFFKDFSKMNLYQWLNLKLTFKNVLVWLTYFWIDWVFSLILNNFLSIFINSHLFCIDIKDREWPIYLIRFKFLKTIGYFSYWVLSFSFREWYWKVLRPHSFFLVFTIDWF